MSRCLISKAHLARLLEVSQPTVTNWCKRGQLYGPALIGTGRAQLVDFDVALEQLGRLDPGQSLGHGRARDDAVDRLIELRREGWQPDDPDQHPANDALYPPVLRQFNGNPVAIGATALAYHVVNNIGAAIAATLMQAGASIEVAYAMEPIALIVACTLAEEAADEIGGFDLRDKQLVDLVGMAKADWPALAKRRGVPFDKAVCDAFAAAIYPESTGEPDCETAACKPPFSPKLRTASNRRAA